MEIVLRILTGILAFLASFAPSGALHYVAPPVEERNEVRVFFAGDIMLDRSVRVAADEKGGDFIFSCIAKRLREADYVVANLEGPITANRSKSVGSSVGDANNTRFTFPTSTATLLKRHNIRAVSLANNHASDFGREGIEATMRYLREAGVGYFGDSLGDSVHSEGGTPAITYIGYNQFDPRGAEISEESALAAVRLARERGELPVVFAHWGDEYVPPTALQKRLARDFIDAGAELVVGAHPHVVQSDELYAGKYIYYSLGNFIFDQYFREEVRNGFILDVVFDEAGVRSVEKIPVYLERDRRTCPTL